MEKKQSLTRDREKALKGFAMSMDGRLLAHLNSCVHCGLCAESCHYYLSTGEEKYMPARKVDQLARIYRRYHTVAGKIFPRWIGASDFNDQSIQEMVDVLFGGCTMCGRCSLHCSIGVDIPFLVRTARSMLVELGRVSPGLQSTVDAAVQTGNNMAIPREELVDTLQWLEEDLRMEVNDEKASIPMDVPHCRLLYTLNPREPKFFPLSISAMAKIFYAADESWTLSTHCYDVTNYAYYSGDDHTAEELTQRLFDEMIKLNAQELVLAECGHGSRAIRWEGPRWLKKKFPFPVISVIELIAGYIHSGRIAVDPSKNTTPVTLHDPCNLVRAGGVIEEQRYVLKKVVSDFREMTPNRENNYCCGGGGGQLSMGEYRERRVAAGKIKADQIKKTGAAIVATPCHNCIDQLMELNKEYSLGVEIKTVGELVADALIL
ncbi:MAG TPA: (Fe-S)-binding protein [bacterium]|nr:(Fe-S)-binding protein [bacterium]